MDLFFQTPTKYRAVKEKCEAVSECFKQSDIQYSVLLMELYEFLFSKWITEINFLMTFSFLRCTATLQHSPLVAGIM